MIRFFPVPWYILSIIKFVVEMLPCMLVALVIFLLLRPARLKRLSAERALVSGVWRERVLLLYVLFLAGLAALTLFPARFFEHLIEFIFNPAIRAQGLALASFYQSHAELMERIANLSDILAPLQEIRRALYTGNSWLILMLLGNIVMFIPLGFCRIFSLGIEPCDPNHEE